MNWQQFISDIQTDPNVRALACLWIAFIVTAILYALDKIGRGRRRY